jgi:hypothetical protein
MTAMKIEVTCGKIEQLSRVVAMVKITGAKTKIPHTRHTMLVLDCSGSMTESIDQVRNDSCKFVTELSDDEYCSVIIFSGHNRARLIAGPTQTNKKGREMVTKAITDEVKILDVTVFSEPLEMVLKTAKKLAGADNAHNCVLFTDGCAVPTKWSAQKEQEKSYAVANELKAAEVGVSVVGYGPHYDIDFLNKLMVAAGSTGIFRHISEIEDFTAAINSVRDVNTKMAPALVDLNIKPANGTAGNVYRVTPEVAMVGQAGKASTRGLYEGDVIFYVELSAENTQLTLNGQIGQEKLDLNINASPLSDDAKANYVRTAAAWAFLNGQRDSAAELLEMVGDGEAAEKAASSFTERERRETVDTMRRYFTGTHRYIGAGLKRQDKRYCVLDIVRELIERKTPDGKPANVVFLGEYKRTGELTVDKDDRVVHVPGGTRQLALTTLQSANERFNFSFKGLKDIKVREDGGQVVDKKQWRNYNVILDGNLHIPQLKANLCKESFDLLVEAGVIKADTPYRASATYDIDLRHAPVISRNWANPATMGLVALLKEEKELEDEQTALNARIKALKASGATLKAAEDNIYNGKSAKDETREKEYYEAKCVEWRLMGYKVSADNVAKAEKLNLEEADKQVKAVRQRLMVVRFITRAVIFAVETVNPNKLGWNGAKETKKGKNPKTETSCTFDGASLKRVVWTEQIACS